MADWKMGGTGASPNYTDEVAAATAAGAGAGEAAGAVAASPYAVAASASAADAQTAETNAETAQGLAEAARDAALATGKVFADTTAGLAATAEGAYFNVPSGSADESLILYRKLSGVAVVIKKLPYAPVILGPAGKNRFSSDTSSNGYTMTTAGAPNASTSAWDLSDYIPVAGGQQITAKTPRFIAEYDAARTFIAGTYKDVTTQVDTSWALNANAAYVRVCYAATGRGSMQVEYGATVTGWERYSLGIFVGATLLLDVGALSGGLMSPPLLSLVNYSQYVDREKYQIYKAAAGLAALRAIYRDIAVQYTGGGAATFKISTTGISGNYSTNQVVFNATNFPGLIAGSTVAHVFVLPWTRNLTTFQNAANWRLVVVTDKGQVFHNYPSRAVGSDGAEVAGDMLLFDESVIWDLAERKYPSTNPAASGVEAYRPGLPAAAYEYHPAVSADPGGYGHGGFATSITVTTGTYPRFYQPKRTATTHSFATMGGFVPGDKISLLGTYQSNSSAGEGARVGVFASSDGGRSWYLKYEFGGQETASNWANGYDLSGLAAAYVASSFVCAKRSPVVPTDGAKEPATKFSFAADTVISAITRASPPVVTAAAHGLSTGNVVVIKDNAGSGAVSPEWDWMRNDSATTTLPGTGQFFKVEVVDVNTFRLHEYVQSPSCELPARHIHHINRIKDGWIVGTGELHPAGWQMHVKLGAADSFDVIQGYSALATTRLNSSPGGVQRTLGALLLDDANQTYVFASDAADITRDAITVPSGRTAVIRRSSTGVYRGRLADIDDFDLFTCIYEAKEPAYFFGEFAGVWIFAGQRSELAISFDKGSTWLVENVASTLQHYQGDSYNRIVVDDTVICLK